MTYSYATTMLQPSSLPLSVRSVEWLRANHGAWLVNTVEHYWYTWHTPKPGGPTLKRLPSVGTPASTPVAAERSRLLATFNSGFTYNDGQGGFSVNGQTATPLRNGIGTVVAYRDGKVDVVSWHGGATPGPNVVLARQNLPLIVVGGHPSPLLDQGRNWGNTLGNAVRVWRSGVGVDRSGNLIYAAADLQTVHTLASILIHAGAVRAIELDINPEWPSFITYGRTGVRDPVKLVPNDQQPASRYLAPDDRDFFAVYRRLPRTLALVPFQ